jgi:nitrogen fixation-related uncharacterized protein
MEAVMMFLITILGLAVLGGASITWGVDSREQYQDDHTR